MNFRERCDAIEECYEFMLAYAGQGLPNDAGSSSGSQVREYLRGAVKALNGLRDSIASEGPLSGEFLDVVERDARDSLAVIGLVLSQPGISSQLIDNLNASIHLRALLTDLFLADEILKLQVTQPGLASG
jgi:hypothetical protein